MEDEVATLSDDCNEITVTNTNEQIEKELNLFSPRRDTNTHPHRCGSRGLINRKIDTDELYPA